MTVICRYMTSYDGICQVIRIPDGSSSSSRPGPGPAGPGPVHDSEVPAWASGTLRYMISYMISEKRRRKNYDIIGFEISIMMISIYDIIWLWYHIFISMIPVTSVTYDAYRGRVVKVDIPCSLGGGQRGFNPRQLRRTKRAFIPPLAICNEA